MGETAAPAGADEAVDALRRRGAEGIDPVGFLFAAGLAARRHRQPDAVRRLLDGRLATALQALEARCAAAEQAAPAAAVVAASAASPLAELVAHTARHGGGDGELKSLRHFGDAWAQLSADRRIAQTLADWPEHAGPLNSHLLVLRTLERLRDTAPGYLRRFMAYADTLLWLDRAQGGGAATKAKPRRGETGKKRKPARGA